jgi:hypothetical protein
MNQDLDRLAKQVGFEDAAHERLRLAFAHACTARVRHLLEDPRVVAALDGLGAYLQGTLSRDQLAALAGEAGRLANQHPGSKSIDGCGHAAVSATYAVSKALAGRAREAADYAAYAIVYAQGGSAAVADRESFDAEFGWQVRCLAALSGQHSIHA